MLRRAKRCRLPARTAARMLFLLGLVTGLAQTPPAAVAQTAAGPALITAEMLIHDAQTGTIVATGRVEIALPAQTLLADQIIWELQTDRLRAVGNVTVILADGEVVFADEAELTDQFRNGFVSGVRVLLADQSRFSAAAGTRTNDGNVTDMVNAVFTACVTCLGGPNPPVWQVRASRIVHDKEARTIQYEHASLEFLGVPVFYTPFFTHPDPTVKRQSGLLAPTYGAGEALGATFEAPYYFNIAPYRDVTLTPLLTTREGPVLKGEYRERSASGIFEARGSITNPEARDGTAKTGGRDLRGHVEANGAFTINDVLRWGFRGARASDDTYQRRYGISSESVLISNAYIEGLEGRNYAAANAWAFQGLREDDDPGQTPLVFPMVEYVLYGPTGARGQYAIVDANALAIRRSEGADVLRLSTEAAWRVPYTSPLGEVYAFSVSARADGYAIDGVRPPGQPDTVAADGFAARFLPRVSLDWRLPTVRMGTRADYTIEPIAALILAPYGGNHPLILNEDSHSFAFNDTNLFSPSRFPGRDRWEGGPRVNYGLKLGAYGDRTAATAMIGQTLRARDDTFGPGSGLERGRSDYVGRINFLWPSFDYQQRFRVDRQSFSLRRNEVDLTLGPNDAQFSVGYVFLSEDPSTDIFSRREELTFGGRLQLLKGWTLTARSRHDLRNDGGLLLAGFGIMYDCDCMNVTLETVRRLTVDRDVPRSTTVTLRISLKHLG